MITAKKVHWKERKVKYFYLPLSEKGKQTTVGIKDFITAK